MARHSKNNTALGFFTHDEKKKANYGTKKQRLGKDSMRKFDSCYLCLNRARSPLSCLKGHVACKECLVEHILSQKAALARQAKQAQIQRKAEEKADQERKQANKAKELEDFEKLQSQVTSVTAIGESNIKLIANSKRSGEPIEFASRSLGAGYSESKLPAFWVPELTPNMGPKMIEAPKSLKITNCTADVPHPITMKQMISIQFSLPKADPKEIKDQDPECPSCLKRLSNSLNPMMVATCGHVFCSPCANKFVAPNKVCFTCDTPCKNQEDLVLIRHDGTGYASGGGTVVASKYSVAFQ